MKTLIIIIGILLIACCLLFLITNYILSILTRHVCAYEKEEPVQFNHIKIVALTGRIRVFSNFGNHLADISKDGPIVYISSRSIGHEAEIRYIIDNYKKIWKSLAN